jgi:hypothetical protein
MNDQTKQHILPCYAGKTKPGTDEHVRHEGRTRCVAALWNSERPVAGQALAMPCLPGHFVAVTVRQRVTRDCWVMPELSGAGAPQVPNEVIIGSVLVMAALSPLSVCETKGSSPAALMVSLGAPIVQWEMPVFKDVNILQRSFGYYEAAPGDKAEPD